MSARRRWFAAFLVLSIMLIAVPRALRAQNDLHASVAGRVYRDDKIIVRVPRGWTVSFHTTHVTGDRSFDLVAGALLRHGPYVLRLCTGCMQASGIEGGRFGEIASLVQPWFREDAGANPQPCGQKQISRVTARIDRVDFWYTRHPAHPPKRDEDDCREPATTVTVWYGTYFTEHCGHAPAPDDSCGGNFLDHDQLTGRPRTFDEMAFGMTFDPPDPSKLPRKGDPELLRALREATVIVASIRYH